MTDNAHERALNEALADCADEIAAINHTLLSTPIDPAERRTLESARNDEIGRRGLLLNIIANAEADTP